MFIKELYEKYKTACSSLLQDDLLSPAEFTEVFSSQLNTMPKVEINDSVENGVLYYRLWEENGLSVCRIPAYGYYASSVKVLSKLFSRLSADLVKQKSTRFEVCLYAHDEEAQRLFSMMQFGYMAETGICPIKRPCLRQKPTYTIQTLHKEEIELHWDEIWSMTGAIIRHLQQAPVFYPGIEFTEKVYRAFFTDENTHLHIALDEHRTVVGMIETNAEPHPFIRPAALSANVGEAYVPTDKRGTGFSDALLYYALTYEQARGAKYLWVEHGTANPQARSFWGKYFTTCTYELDRTIEHL